ncbi:MAG: hypothetical protein AB1609_03145 [Bacillota bacterium]
MSTVRIRVVLPGHLARLAGAGGRVAEVTVEAEAPGPGALPTVGAAVYALERAYPALRGTLTAMDPAPPGAARLRPYLRVFAASQDLTPGGLAVPLPAEVLSGAEPLRIVGAIAGG